MRRFLGWLLRVIRTTLHELLWFVWEQFQILIRGVTNGVAQMLQRLAPWVIGVFIFWFVMTRYPELGNQLIALALMVAVLVFMFRKLLWKSSSRGNNQNRKG